MTFGTLVDNGLMRPNKLLIPTNEIQSIKNLPFKKRKTLGGSARAFDAACYSLHKAFLSQYTSDTEWAPLWSQLMGQIAGHNRQWALTKNILVGAGYLECDRKCKQGEKSYCFKLGPKLKDTQWDYADKVLWLPEDTRPKWKGLELNYEFAHQIVDAISVARNWHYRTTKGWHTRVDQFSPHYAICKTGRAYTDANQFPAELRDALLIDGEETLEIDVVNCQPTLLATVYPEQSAEWMRYKTLAEEGVVYEELAKFAGITRKEAKDQFLPFIFGGKRPVAEEFFGAEFPELLEAILGRRDIHRKRLSYELQGKESDLIVEGLCSEFRAVSIHDGVRVKRSDAGRVKGRLIELFKEMWSLTPKVTIGTFGQGELLEAA